MVSFPQHAVFDIPHNGKGNTASHAHKTLNPFMPGDLAEYSVVWIYDTFENNLWIKHNFTKYFKESCGWYSDQHFFLKYFLNNTLVRAFLGAFLVFEA